ncbi:MAG TPA: rhomboid family intramembrane serine protease, partial [Pyrinomonadaceae bacterium]|nr:rhomboid family intramembrane serine protease [Pyrinomonadaceae bacterium]
DAASRGRPSMCRSCGAIVGAGETACAVCGTPVGATSAEAARIPRHDVETMRFARAILTRPATFTFIFLAVNVLIFLLMQFAGGTENVDVLRAYGAKYNSLINQREWWRLVTPVFIHIGWIHLLVNMYSLFILGPYVERLYGSAKFVCFWLVTGIAGVGASYLASSSGRHPSGLVGYFLFRGGDGPSAGASGALFGLVGVLFVFGIKFRHELPEGFKRAFGTGMLPTILINLFIGFSIPMIDNSAHLGGFLAGCVLALFVGYRRPDERGAVTNIWRVLQIAALVLVIVSFGEVARRLGDARPKFNHPAARLINAGGPDLPAYINAVNAGQEAFPKVIKQADTNAAEQAIARLDSVPPFNEHADALREQLKQLLARARDYAKLPDKERRTAKAQTQLLQLIKDYSDWEARFDQWVKTEGQNYGLQLQNETQDTQPDKAPDK